MSLYVVTARVGVRASQAPDYATLRAAMIRAGVPGGAWIGDPRVVRSPDALTVTCVWGAPARGPWDPRPPLRGPSTPSAQLLARVRAELAALGEARTWRTAAPWELGAFDVQVAGSAYSAAANGPVAWWVDGRAARNMTRDELRTVDGSATGPVVRERPAGPTPPSGRLPETAGETALRLASTAEDRARDAARAASSWTFGALGTLAALWVGYELLRSRRR